MLPSNLKTVNTEKNPALNKQYLTSKVQKTELFFSNGKKNHKIEDELA